MTGRTIWAEGIIISINIIVFEIKVPHSLL